MKKTFFIHNLFLFTTSQNYKKKFLNCSASQKTYEKKLCLTLENGNENKKKGGTYVYTTV